MKNVEHKQDTTQTNADDEITITRPQGMHAEDWATLRRILTIGLGEIIAAIEKTGR